MCEKACATEIVHAMDRIAVDFVKIIVALAKAREDDSLPEPVVTVGMNSCLEFIEGTRSLGQFCDRLASIYNVEHLPEFLEADALYSEFASYPPENMNLN
jgi:hypothetical protein